MKKQYLLLLPILAAALILYLPAVHYGFFLWDDEAYVITNHLAHDFGWRETFTQSYNGNYHPVTILSLAADYQIGKLLPAVYHWHNLLLHLCNIILVFVLTHRLSKDLSISAFVCLLFSLHPLHTESVIWVSERKNLLYTMYFLISLIFYLRYCEKMKLKYLAAACFFFILSVLSKGQAVMLTFCLIAADIFLHRNMLSKRVIIEKIPFLAITIAFSIITVASQHYEGYLGIMQEFTAADRLFTGCVSFFLYIYKILMPMQLSIFYPYTVRSGSLFPLYYYIAPFAATGLIVMLIVFRKKLHRLVIFGFLLFAFNIALILQFISFGEAIMADRYTYLPSIGIFLIAGVFFSFLLKRSIYFVMLPLIYLCTLFCLCYQRTSLWKQNKDIVVNALDQYPESTILLNNMASLQMKEQDYTAALKTADKCISLDTAYADAYYTRALICSKKGDYRNALINFTKVTDLNPLYYDAWYGRGNIFLDQGEYYKAMGDYDQAITIAPGYADAYNNRGLAKTNSGNHSGAVADFTHAILLDPLSYRAYFNRGYCYGKFKNYHDALSDFDAAIRINPAYAESFFYRGLIKFELLLDGCADLERATKLGSKKAAAATVQYCL